jgi:surfactin synthase thioesterase subunit
MPDGCDSLRWFERGAPPPDTPLRLVCFPHAGASAFVFRDWHALAPPGIGVASMQLPGRGERLREPAVRRLGPLVRAAGEALRPYLDRPFALFGHSVGALVAFELARLLAREYGRVPERLFVSGRPAPDRPPARRPIHDLPTPAFIDALKDFDPTLRGLLEDPEALELFLPILRADLEVSETWSYQPGAPLDCPITVFGGDADRTVSRDDLEGWRRCTTHECAIHVLPGDHFFVMTRQREVLRTIDRALGAAHRTAGRDAHNLKSVTDHD